MANAPRKMKCTKCHAMVLERDWEEHVRSACPVRNGAESRRQKVRLQQSKARKSGKSWVEAACVGCGADIHVHVDWEGPSLLCRDCAAWTRDGQIEARIEETATRSLTGKPLSSGGHEVLGGLPSLGKRH